MNINGYIQKYRNATFREMPFNEVDALVLSQLSYCHIEDYAPSLQDFETKPMPLKDLGDPKKTKKLIRGSIDAKLNAVMIKALASSRRYQNIGIAYCDVAFFESIANQFAAFTFLLPDDTAFIAFRGTDETAVGWKEDLQFAYSMGLLCEMEAEDYVKRLMQLCDRSFYIGGHSKGGHLAIAAATALTKEESAKLIQAYSFDGPGFRFGVERRPGFHFVKRRLSKYLTENDLIGMFFNQAKNPAIVRSTGLLLGGHDPFAWQVSNKEPRLIRAKDRSASSKQLTETFHRFILGLPDDELRMFLNSIFVIFPSCKTVFDILTKGLADLLSINKHLSVYPPEQQKRIREIALSFFKIHQDVGKEMRLSKKKGKPAKEPLP